MAGVNIRIDDGDTLFLVADATTLFGESSMGELRSYSLNIRTSPGLRVTEIPCW